VLNHKTELTTIPEALLNILPYIADPENTEDAAAKGLRFSDLYEQLRARVVELPTPRSVRRIMAGMSDYVDHVGHTNAARWFKVRDTAMLGDQWRMNVDTAIALITLQRMATHQLPGAVFTMLAPRFAEARATLDLNVSEQAKKGKSWGAKIMMASSAQPLILPQIDDEIYNRVTDALMRDKQIDILYEPNKPETQIADYRKQSPLGLIEDQGIYYLVAQSSVETRMFRLDQIKGVKMRDDSVATTPGFDLNTFVKQRGLAEFKPEPEVELKLRVHARDGQYRRTAAQHALTQFKLNESQRIVEWAEDKRSFVLTATVRSSVSLRNFLHSQSNTIEVLAPASIRDEFAERIWRMAERYAPQTKD
jgi:predicted DNA-binding transcriptional regulator YafY